MASTNSLAAWRSPPPQETPLVEVSSLPRESPLHPPGSPGLRNGKQDLLHPSFLPPCEHGQGADMHGHAFDLLSLSGASPASARATLPDTQTSPSIAPSSVPIHPSSILSTSRPVPLAGSGSAAGLVPKARRMSSSTTGVLGRGKLGLTGEATPGSTGASKERPPFTSYGSSHTGSMLSSYRRPSVASPTNPAPQLFDFAKTDRMPVDRSNQTSDHGVVPASLPTRSILHSRAKTALPSTADEDNELDMAFDGDEEDEHEDGGGRSGSAEPDIDMDEDDEGEIKSEWKKLALGTGSGGVKGRRKGMVFKCENCSKEYRHPSCLIKHRWEHSPHWKEPTTISMSKHQQVQMLEAAAILAHLHPSQGRSLPNDKSLWPAVLSPPGADSPLRRSSVTSRDLSAIRSPSSSNAPLTPSSLRDMSTLGMGPKARKASSPGTDSTTSSNDGSFSRAGNPSQPTVVSRSAILGSSGARPVVIDAGRSSSVSSVPGPGTPQSVGSLPNELASLHFHPGVSAGRSPIPNRAPPMSLNARAGLIGGGMFGAFNTAMPSSSVRSGALADDEEDESILASNARISRGQSSSEEAEDRRKGREGEEWGMAMEMEL